MQQNTRIGRYIVDRRVGAGGMAVTYLCRLDGIGGFQKLALVKMLHTRHLSDEAYIQMFLDEARLGALLHHPNISQVFEIGEQDNAPFFVMEYVPGPNLAKVVKKLGNPEERPYGHFAGIMASVSRALDFAHGLTDDAGKPLNVIHRDVSLGNILIAPTGVAKLIDFGIAKWEMKKNVTEVGMIKGKLHYMAPEQLTDTVDHRVDIYQAGVCLYWCCTGVQPFQGEDAAQVWRDRLVGRVRKPSELVPDIPPVLENIILKAMEPSPADRFQTAGEMAEALDAFCGSAPAWRTGERELSGFLRALFSEEEMANYRAGNSDVTRTSQSTTGVHSLGQSGNTGINAGVENTSTSHTGTSHTNTSLTAGSQGVTSTTTMPLPQQRRTAVIWAMTGALLALGGVLMLAGGGEGEEDPAVVAVSASDANANARAYVEAAEAAATAERRAEAREYLTKAKAAGSADAHIDIRISQLERMLNRADQLATARKALANGDPQTATNLAYELLDVNASDAEAAEIVNQAAALSAEPAVAVVEPAEKPEEEPEPEPPPVKPEPVKQPPARDNKAREVRGTSTTPAGRTPPASSQTEVTPVAPAAVKYGTLSVGFPTGATVVIDGSNFQEVPFNVQLPVGEHELVFSKEGFLNRTTTVTILEGRSVSSSPTLVAKATEAPPVSKEPVSDKPAPVDEGAAIKVAQERSALAATLAASSDSELENILGAVERDAQRRGVDSKYVNGITRSVFSALINIQPPPDVYNVRPAAMSDAIVSGFKAGQPADAVRKSLAKSFGR